jgi:anti-anti-sigma regulatory factor
MLRITRVTTTGTPTLILSGRIGAEQLPEVRRSVEAEQVGELVLDLREVTLVDVDVVRFFLRCDQQGIRFVHCPTYIREWMARENRST